MHETYHPPPTTFGEPIVTEILVSSEVTSLRAPQAASQANPLVSPKVTATMEVSSPSFQGLVQVYEFFTIVFYFI